jgi:hypothetical protein
MTDRRGLLRFARLALALTVAGAVAAPSPLAAAAAPQERATQPTDLLVRVTDEAGEGIAGHEVFVIVSNSMEVAEELTGTTDDDGELRFEGVPVATGYMARPIAVFEGYPYQGDAAPLTAGVEALLPLTVFTVDSSPANLHIDVFHIILNVVEPGVYQVVQVMGILNVGERAAYSGEEFDGRRVGIVIPLPAGVSTFTPLPPEMSGLDAESLAQDGNRLLDLRPVPPGNHQVAVQYEILTDPDGGDVEVTLPYPTAQVSMLVGPGVGTVVIESDQLQELEPVDIPSQGQYANFTSDVIAGGEILRFRIGPPEAPMTTASWSLLALAAALLASAAASILFGAASAPDPGERSGLIAEVARLDAQHDSGALEDAEYHGLRGAAIGRLMELDGVSGATRGADGE